MIQPEAAGPIVGGTKLQTTDGSDRRKSFFKEFRKVGYSSAKQ